MTSEGGGGGGSSASDQLHRLCVHFIGGAGGSHDKVTSHIAWHLILEFLFR